MRKIQTIIVTMLIMSLMTSMVLADTVINLSGQIDPAEIEIGISSANIELDMAAGQTQAQDSITITSTSLIPVKVELTEFKQEKADRWNPTLVTDLSGISLTEAQNQAKLTLSADGDFDRVGTASQIFTASTTDIDLGGIEASADGIVEKEIELTAQLEVDKRRILGKAFEGELTLTFSADV